jgi:hypothetical protein
MRKEHKEIQRWIKKKYSKHFDIYAEAIDGKNYLPDMEKHAYEPDVLIKARDSNKINYIIEVESDPMRKSIVGASILADYSISMLKRMKPTLIFVVYLKEGIKQIPNFKEKRKIAKKYCKNLNDILVYSVNDFKKLKL